MGRTTQDRRDYLLKKLFKDLEDSFEAWDLASNDALRVASHTGA
jgi:hypothetical protein